jgi:aspartyl-tRNA(Asn)/glutamyl-tRNA(Gln) amidotransferase subunit C
MATRTHDRGLYARQPLQQALIYSRCGSQYAYFAHPNVSRLMKITQEEAKHVAKLARLKLSPQELETYTSQLDAILQAFQKLSEVKTSGTPSSAAFLSELPLRDDRVVPPMPHEQVLQNAPAKEQGGFSVPKIVEK